MSASTRPDEAALASFWKGTAFALLDPPTSESAMGRLLEQLDLAHGNGGAFFLRFQFHCEPGSTGDWFVARNLFVDCRFFENMLTSRAFLDLFEPGSVPNHQEPIGWDWGNPYTLAGEWAFRIKAGGVFSRAHASGAETMRLSEAARDELFGDRYEDQWIFSCSKAWNDWFFGRCWDKTWVGYDKMNCRAWVLCVTDTD